MIGRVRIMAAVAAVLSLASTGCIVVGVGGWSSWRGSTVWTEASTERIGFDAAGLGAVEVRTHNGSITFDGQPAGAGEAYVTVTKKAGGLTQDDAEEALEAIEVYVQRVGLDTQRIGWKWKGTKHAGWGARVSFDINAPGRLRVDGETHNGAITVRGIVGEVRVETHNGPVNVESSQGKLYAETHNGEIVATYAGDDVTLTTHNGRVVADLSGCGTIEGNITTHNGSIEVVVGADTATNLTCRTHNGSIRCDAPLETSRFSRRKLTARIGAGGGALDVTTHNGSVRIRKATG